MKVRRRRKKDIRRILIKTVLYATLLAAGELLAGVGGYYCIMTHLPDAVGIPLLTAGFFLIVVFSCSVQEEYDRLLSARYSGRPISRVERKKEMTVKVFMDLDGVLARWDSDASVEDTYAPGFFLTREPEPEAIAAVRLMRKNGLDVYILSCAYQNGLAEPEKDKWLAMVGLSDIPRIFVPYGKRKTDYATAADISILVDDYTQNLHEWSAEGNIACKFYNGVNGKNGTWSGYSVNHVMTAEEIAGVISTIARTQAGLQGAA